MKRINNMMLASLIAMASTATYADIEFFNGDNGNGGYENSLSDQNNVRINLKADRDWNNDEIRSLRLKSVARGTKIYLFDHPEAKTNDDWVEIIVTQSGDNIVVPNLEKTIETNHYKQTFHRVNGLNGKVSAIQVIKAPKTSSPSNLSLKAKFEREYAKNFSWNDKEGRAARYNVDNSNYRLWKPTISELAGGGLFVTMKMDHIRGSAKDDYATVTMTFNKLRQVTDLTFKITIANDQTYTKTLDDIANVSKTVVKSSTKNPKALAAAEASAAVIKLAGSIYGNAVGPWADRGGRQNFPNVIRHQANEIIKIMNNVR